MRIRKIAVLIDGGFFIRRLPRLISHTELTTPAEVAEAANDLCKSHVQKLTGEDPKSSSSRWLDHVYRLFYYDAYPYNGVAHHPVENRQIMYAKTPEAGFRESLFHELRSKPKFALRLGKVVKETGWQIRDGETTKRLLKTREWVDYLEAVAIRNETAEAPLPIAELQKIFASWRGLKTSDIKLGLRQKGVDMRIGVDISALTLKKHVDTLILVTGDSDFVPAAKLARREGVEIILDPLGQNINDDLHEHVDSVTSLYKIQIAPPQTVQKP